MVSCQSQPKPNGGSTTKTTKTTEIIEKSQTIQRTIAISCDLWEEDINCIVIILNLIQHKFSHLNPDCYQTIQILYKHQKINQP